MSRTIAVFREFVETGSMKNWRTIIHPDPEYPDDYKDLNISELPWCSDADRARRFPNTCKYIATKYHIDGKTDDEVLHFFMKFLLKYYLFLNWDGVRYDHSFDYLDVYDAELNNPLY